MSQGDVDLNAMDNQQLFEYVNHLALQNQETHEAIQHMRGLLAHRVSDADFVNRSHGHGAQFHTTMTDYRPTYSTTRAENSQRASEEGQGAINRSYVQGNALYMNDASYESRLSPYMSPSFSSCTSSNGSNDSTTNEEPGQDSPASANGFSNNTSSQTSTTSLPPPPKIPTCLPLISSGSASNLKRTFSEALGLTSNGRRLTGEHNPENVEILRLRQEEHLDFDEIALVMNKKRSQQGANPDLTANAIYGRYKRNGPLIAAANGKEFVPIEKDKAITFRKELPVRGWNGREDEFLAKATHEVSEEFWTLVSERIRKLGGDSHSAELCALRYGKL